MAEDGGAPGVRPRVGAAVGSLFDTVLDRTVVLGYSRVGSALRRATGSPDGPRPGALDGRNVLLTGASSGIGRAAVRGLADLGADVHLIVRDRAKGEAARTHVGAHVPIERLHVHVCDVADLDSVRAFAADWVGDVDVLVHNAGTMPPRRTETAQGIETTFATHVAGPFLLTALLRERLTSPSRVVLVSSGGMYAQRLPGGDLQSTRGGYRPAVTYARTKRMQVVLAEQLAERLRDHGAVVHSGHPGWADTPGVASALPGFRAIAGPILRTPEDGADLVTYLAAAPWPGRTTGLFWHDRRPRPTHWFGLNRESFADRELLWAECVRLTGATF